MMTEVIDKIFDNVKYWQEKKLLLQAISPDHYYNKNIMLRLLGVTEQSVSEKNYAKKDMWNHHLVNNNMGDDILKQIPQTIMNDMDFVKSAINKYNRAYIYIGSSLKGSRELAKMAAFKEDVTSNRIIDEPILKYMPESFRLDHEIALMATTRNVDNLQYATNLKRNKYFIIDLMNYIYDFDIKKKVLQYIDKALLDDKRFVSKLGCFDHLCEKFHGDKTYVASAVRHDMGILKKTNIFDQSIIKSALRNTDKNLTREETLAEIFRYIERFNDDYDELDHNIRDKKLLKKLFWEFGEIVSNEFF
jgi:hypothetical protein